MFTGPSPDLRTVGRDLSQHKKVVLIGINTKADKLIL